MAKIAYICDNCSTAILNAEEGVLIRGNLYTADPRDRGGLVGNAFPNPADGKITASEIKEYAMCKQCFEQVLPWNKK